MAFIEPFYVGAGFGLYLNRRTQLEAWDLEIAFRRMRKRLEAVGTTVLLALALCLPMAMPAHARDDNTCPFPETVPETVPDTGPGQAAPGAPGTTQDSEKQTAQEAAEEAAADMAASEESPASDVETRTLREIFGKDSTGQAAFEKSVAQAYKDPLLRPKLEQTTWQPRDRDKKKDKPIDADRKSVV